MGSNYFEYPLEKKLYTTKSNKAKQKPPIRVLITEASSTIAYNLLYKVFSGEIFGEDQEIILRLINPKGKFVQNGLISELFDCGFHVVIDAEVVPTPHEAYNKVDLVVCILSAEQSSGFSDKENLSALIYKINLLAKNIVEFASSDVKVVVTGPSTKLSLFVLYIINKLQPNIKRENITAVTLLDQTIAENYIADKLNTTTNMLKDVYIWGSTCPDVTNATVLTYPHGDIGAEEMIFVPVSAAINDDKWIRDTLVKIIYDREMEAYLLVSGMSVASATSRHLKALYRGTESGEVVSMGILAPGDVYLVPAGVPFSFPVVAENGNYKIVQNLKYDVRTQLLLIKMVHDFETDRYLNVNQICNYLLDVELNYGISADVINKKTLIRVIHIDSWNVKYLLCPLPEELIQINQTNKDKRSKKFIVWQDKEQKEESLRLSARKSSLRFDDEDEKITPKPKCVSILKLKSTSSDLHRESNDQETKSET